MNYEAIIAQKDREIDQLKFELNQLKKLIFGSKRERFITEEQLVQPTLFSHPHEDDVSIVEEQKQTISYERKKSKNHPGRNSIPDHLPVEEVIIEPEVDTTDMVRIGEQVTETLDYRPASLIRIRRVRPKYVERAKDQIFIAPLPERPFPKFIAETSLLAFILVSKFVDHLPYYRQIQRFNREFKWVVSKSTVNNWMAACCTLLKPLYAAMEEMILQSEYIQADESPIKVLDSDKPGKTHQGYQWVYHAPEKGIVYFHYRRGRGMHGPKELLMNYEGFLQCDGYKVYDKIGKRQGVVLLGCLVHVRRKFFEAKENDSKRAEYALKIIGEIYQLEKQIKIEASTDEMRLQLRKEEIYPKLEALKLWVENESVIVTPKSRIGKAMTYFQNQWLKLKNIFMDGKLELDNNLIENKIRPLALGRKNYLFAGSDQGAEWAAMMYSFFATCKIHNVNPQEWLTWVMENIKDTNIQNLESLLPQNWSK